MQISPWTSFFPETSNDPRARADSLCEISPELEIPLLEEKYFNCARSLTASVFDRESEEVGRSIFQSLCQYSKNLGVVQRAGDQDWEVVTRRHHADLAANFGLVGIGIALMGLGIWRGGVPGGVAGAILAVALIYYVNKTPKLELVPTFDYRKPGPQV